MTPMTLFPGSGGSLTIRESPDRIFIAPSGVQKERIKAEDVFIIDRNAEVIQRPPGNRNLRPSQCTPLFMVAYNGNIIKHPNLTLISFQFPTHSYTLQGRRSRWSEGPIYGRTADALCYVLQPIKKLMTFFSEQLQRQMLQIIHQNAWIFKIN